MGAELLSSRQRGHHGTHDRGAAQLVAAAVTVVSVLCLCNRVEGASVGSVTHHIVESQWETVNGIEHKGLGEEDLVVTLASRATLLKGLTEDQQQSHQEQQQQQQQHLQPSHQTTPPEQQQLPPLSTQQSRPHLAIEESIVAQSSSASTEIDAGFDTGDAAALLLRGAGPTVYRFGDTKLHPAMALRRATGPAVDVVEVLSKVRERELVVQ